MRRVIAVLAVVILFSACASDGGGEALAENLGGSFCMVFAFSDGGFSGVAEFRRTSADEFSLEIIEPARLFGYSLALSDGVVTSSFAGLTREVAENDVAQASMFSALCSMCRLATGEPVSERTQDGYLFSDFGGTVVRSADGIPAGITAAAAELTIQSFVRLNLQ